jgi:hypothetical protein
VDVPAQSIGLAPTAHTALGALTVAGLRAGEEDFSVEADRDGNTRIIGCSLHPSSLGQ